VPVRWSPKVRKRCFQLFNDRIVLIEYPYSIREPNWSHQIKFTEWTPDGHLRHSKFVGFREDRAEEVVWEDWKRILY
jgi:ATP-dependent DNA ligase